MTTKIACSPLTGRIYSGKLNKAGDAFVGEKKDVTSDFMQAVIEKANFHGGEFDIVGGDRRWKCTVVEGLNAAQRKEAIDDMIADMNGEIEG